MRPAQAFRSVFVLPLKLGRSTTVGLLKNPVRKLCSVHCRPKPWLGVNLHTIRSPARSSYSTTASTPGTIECSINPVTPSSSGEGTFATVTIRNASKLNSLDSGLIAQLTATLQTLASEPDLRVAVIKGEHDPASGKTPAFTSGANIHEMSALEDSAEAAEFISRLATMCEAVRTLPCLTIAQIHGLCLGGGLEAAACADFRYATAGSKFGMPETKFGIPSVIHARLLVDLVGWQRTREMVYLAKIYEADEMHQWGLIDKVCASPAELDDHVQAFVGAVARHGVKTMRVQKELVRAWQEEDFRTGIQKGVQSFARMFEGRAEEPRRFMREFTQRKKG